MVDYNGSIFTQIPKSIDNGGIRVDITGMTLNNYVWDDVHKDYNGKNQKEDNAQTYDYDDFVKIAESSVAPDNIIYRFKYNEFKNEPKATLEASKADLMVGKYSSTTRIIRQIFLVIELVMISLTIRILIV